MKIRVTKSAEMDINTMKTITANTLFHLFVDKEDGNGEKEVCTSKSKDTMLGYIAIYKDIGASFDAHDESEVDD